jgi:hypothetical protein
MTEPERFFPPTGVITRSFFVDLWADDYGLIFVEFDEENKVISVEQHPFHPALRRSWFERARDRVRSLAR